MLRSLTSDPTGAIFGTARIPGDKSISHRALLVGTLAQGETTIAGLLESDDVINVIEALRALDAEVWGDDGGVWHVGGGKPLREPSQVLDLGNSGTGARLLLGLLAGCPFTTFLSGDQSLRERPMARVMEPLSAMGAHFHARSGGRLPLAVTGEAKLKPLRAWHSPVASAQVKSAVLLAALRAGGTTTWIEPSPSRNHTEIMLRHFGAEIVRKALPQGAVSISLSGKGPLSGRSILVPGDISSAAFPLVAALIRPDSEVVLPGIGVNPSRMGLVETLLEMGADIRVENLREENGEPVADLYTRSSALHGVAVPAARAPLMIDEYPILAVAAALAEGETAMEGVGELRVKESDRIARMADGLSACGIAVESTPDSLIVRGMEKGYVPRGGARVETGGDHRIAMSFLILGMACEDAVEIDDGACISTSFPTFSNIMNGLGADIHES